jgi:hypothetical protein
MTDLQFRLIVTGSIILLIVLGLSFGEDDGRVNMMEKTREWLKEK